MKPKTSPQSHVGALAGAFRRSLDVPQGWDLSEMADKPATRDAGQNHKASR